MGFLAALRFLTIIPLPWRREVSQEALGRSAVYFPLVGLMIGLFLVGWHWLLGILLPRAVVDVLVMVTLVILTGALHLDGFIDTFDGIAGHKSVEERWQVMHDSRTGGIGVVAVVCLLLVKYFSLSSLGCFSIVSKLRTRIVMAIANIPSVRASTRLVFNSVVVSWATKPPLFINQRSLVSLVYHLNAAAEPHRDLFDMFFCFLQFIQKVVFFKR